MNVRTKVPSSTEQVVAAVAEAQPDKALVVHQAPVKAYPPKIAKAILNISRTLDPVRKSGANTFHGYQYPKWETVLEQLGPLIAENGLIIIPSETYHGGFQDGRMVEITYEFTIINEDGDVWPDRPVITQMCKIVDNKGQIDDKAASKVLTQAQKYFYTSLFKIRTREMEEDDLDYDATKHKVAKKRAVPTSSGKVAPHLLAIKENEGAKAWSARFIEFYTKAETEAECAEWDKTNDANLNRLSEHAADVYNELVDAMNAKLATFKPAEEMVKAQAVTEKKEDPITSGPIQTERRMPPRPSASSTEPTKTTVAIALPTPETDREGWLAWIESRCNRAVEGKAGEEAVDALNEAFERMSQSIEAAPADAREEANGIYQKLFKKFEP